MRRDQGFEVLKLSILGVGHDEKGPFVLLRENLQSRDGTSGTLRGAQKFRPGQKLVWTAQTETRTNLNKVETQEEDN